MNMRETVDPLARTQQASETVKSAIHNVATKAGARAYDAYAQSKDRIDHAIDAASDGVERVEELLIANIKQNPVSAAAIALGAGVFIGLMISRKD